MGSPADIAIPKLTDNPTKESFADALSLCDPVHRISSFKLYAPYYMDYFYDTSFPSNDIYDKIENADATIDWVLSRKPKAGRARELSLSTFRQYFKMILKVIFVLYFDVSDTRTLPFVQRYTQENQRLKEEEERMCKEQAYSNERSPRALRVIDIVKNRMLLALRETIYPDNQTLHINRLIYDLYLCCGFEHFTFRLDITYSVKLVDMASRDYMKLKERYDSEAINYLLFDSTSSDVPLTLVYNKDKTIRDQSRARYNIIPESFRPLLLESLTRFPRDYLFRKYSGFCVKTSARAGGELKNAFILRDTPIKPGADDLRSAFITFYVMRYPTYKDKERYMINSGSTPQQMEMFYNKTNTELYDLMLREDCVHYKNNFADVRLTDEEKARARITRKRKAKE